VVTVEANKAETLKRDYFYQGISARPFKRQSASLIHVQVQNASFDNGLLRIDLVREIPEAMKPRAIPIAGGDAPAIEQIDAKRAA
jgi:molecular chaperone IbpA